MTPGSRAERVAARRAARRRLRWSAAVLAIAAAAVGGSMVLVESGGAVEVRSGVTASTRVVTPILSVRRSPEFLIRPVANRRLRAALVPAMAGVPEAHCLVVGSGSETIFAVNPQRPLAAASNQKIVTALTAIDTLGADTRLTTRVAASSEIADGTVSGDLWVIGGGDPVIDSDSYQATLRFGPTPHTRVEDIADRIVSAGVRRVTGGVRGDDTRYDAQRVIPSWPERFIAQNQVGPLSALAVNDAKSPSVMGGVPIVSARAADPPAAFAAGLTELLRARGVVIDGPPGSGTAPPSLTTVVDVESLPVSALVGQMLTWSDNNTAELLLKEVGRAASGDGTTVAGIAAAMADLEDRGVSTNGIELFDGAGLDPTNRLSCAVLDAALASDGPSGPIASGLAVAGESGTLSDRFRRSPAAGRTRAKTGTLRGVSALSGWVESNKNVPVRFSLVLNNGETELSAAQTAAEQRVPEALLSYPDAPEPTILEPLPARQP